MTELAISRRDTLKAAGMGLLGLAGVSTVGRTSGHESLDVSAVDLLGPILVPADSDYGFNYPYYLYAPQPTEDDQRPILVEPNNTGTATDDYAEHRKSARNRIHNGVGRTLSEALTVPLLMPVFPRPRSDPVDWRHYTHALDVDTMETTTGELARIDEQLLRMVDHAQEILSGISYPVGDDIILDGFSAAGNFVNRFTALHPERIRSVTAGGVNGTPILPISEDNGHTLNYHIGIADLESLVGREFDLESFNSVDQFIYMGADDDNDTIPYSDAWSAEQREIALDVYGQDMQKDRMPYAESVYQAVGASAEFRIYDGVGHGIPLKVQKDLVDVHRQNVGIFRIEFADPPSTDDSEITVDAHAYSTRDIDSVDLRVRSDRRGDLTAAPPTISTGKQTSTTVPLTDPLQTGETVSILALESGNNSPEQALKSEQADVVDTATVDFAEQPVAGDATVTLQYAIDSDYSVETPIHVRLEIASESRILLDTLDPGVSGTSSYELDTAEAGIPLATDDRLTVRFEDVDKNIVIATAETTVSTKKMELDTPATVEFADQPLMNETEIAVQYSVHEEYEPSGFLSLTLLPPGRTPIHLDILTPGEQSTATFNFDKLPLDAGDELKLQISDDQTLARDRETVLVREHDTEEALTATFSYSPDPAVVGESVSFDGSASDAADGDIRSYTWRFGESETGIGDQTTHAFTSSGAYTVRLTVTDGAGHSATATKEVVVEEDNSSRNSDATDGEGRQLGGIASDYDTDNDGEISISELSAAAVDYVNREISLSELGDVAATYAVT